MGIMLLFYFLYTVFNPQDDPHAPIFVLFVLALVFSFSIPMVTDGPDLRQLGQRIVVGALLVGLPLAGLVLESLDATFHEDFWKAFGGFLLIWVTVAMILAVPCVWIAATLQESDGHPWQDWWRTLPLLAVVVFLAVSFAHPGLRTRMGDWFDAPGSAFWTFGILFTATATIPTVWGWPRIRTLLVRTSKVLFIASLAAAGFLLHFNHDMITRPLPGLWMFLITSIPFWLGTLLVFAALTTAGILVTYGARWVAVTLGPVVRSHPWTMHGCATVRQRFDKK